MEKIDFPHIYTIIRMEFIDFVDNIYPYVVVDKAVCFFSS